MTDKNINWDATAFFASLTETNKFAKTHDFVFAKVSGLDSGVVSCDFLTFGYRSVARSFNKTSFLVWRKP